tara:strand:+ start:144 stop:1319 length:1176 start_codon:yes stop_codon:yes gene_type:complete
MHLFIVDQYITLDMFSPIVHSLSKDNKKIYIYNFNYVQKFKKEKKLDFILKNKNTINLSVSKFFDFKFFIKYFFLSLISKLPGIITKKFYNYWREIYAKKILISEKKFINFIKEKKIKTISIDESLPQEKRNFILNIKKKCFVKILVIHGGLHTLKAKQNINKFLSKIDYYLSPGKIPIYTYSLKKKFIKSKKYIEIGSPRYAPEWIKVLDRINKINKKDFFFSKKIKIGIFIRNNNFSNDKFNNLIKKLSKLDFIEIRFNSKPRDSLPESKSIIFKNKYNSSELISWSDIIISYSTSIIVEAILKDKKTILLDYIKVMKKNENSWFKKFKIINLAKKDSQVLNIIKNFDRNAKLTSNNAEKLKMLEFFISYKKGKNILERYKNFYKKIEI